MYLYVTYLYVIIYTYFDNMENPFEYQRVVIGKTFVNRKEEIKTLKQALLSNENILLYSPRRLGKTSLLKQLLSQINGDHISVYVDLWECLTEHEIAEKIANGIINASFTKIEKAAGFLKEALTSTRPFLTINSDGSLELKFDFFEKDKTLRETLKLVEYIAKKKNKKVIVVVDECQVIAEFEKNRIEKIFRTEIQTQTFTTYVFSGSKQHVLKAMINQRTRPFYKQLRPMTLGPISIEKFTPFIKKNFSKISSISNTTIEEIYNYSSGNPQRTQQICHFLFNKACNNIKPTTNEVKNTVVELCLSLNKEFEDELGSIKNKRQRAILKALAIDSKEKPLSAEFRKKHSLGASSSVQTALKMLKEKGILDDKNYFVDPLFEKWIIFKHKKII